MLALAATDISSTTPCWRRSSGHVADAEANGLGRRRDAHRLPVHHDLAGVGRRQPEQDLRQLRAPRAHQSGEPENLSAPDRQGDVVDPAAAVREVTHLERDVAELDASLREDGGKLAPDHQANELAALDRPGLAGRDGFAVAEDRDAIRDGGDLLEAVRDVDDAGAVLAEPGHHGEQPLDLALAQRRGRLVHDEYPRVGADRLGDLDDLLLRHAERLDEPFGIDRGADAAEQLRRVLTPGFPAQSAPGAAALERQRDVLGDGQVREERGLLVDRRDAKGARRVRVDMRDGPARDGQRAGIGALRAGHDLDERRFAGAVLPDERVDLPGAQVEGHAAQGAHAGERLADAAGFEQKGRGVGHAGCIILSFQPSLMNAREGCPAVALAKAGRPVSRTSYGWQASFQLPASSFQLPASRAHVSQHWGEIRCDFHPQTLWELPAAACRTPDTSDKLCRGLAEARA